MRWAVFALAAFVVLVLDRSFMGIFMLPTIGQIAPNIVMTLLVFTALFASRQAALGGALILGAIVDLTEPLRHQDGAAPLYLIGPHALGYLFAAYLVLQIRTMVFRQRVVTVSVLTAMGILAASLVAITIYVIRSWYGEPFIYLPLGSAMRELLRHGGIAVYSALLAIPLGWALLASTPLWAFHFSQPRRAIWR